MRRAVSIRCRALSLLAGALLSAAATAGPADSQPAAAPSEAANEGPENYCIGGIEDRKIIVDERRVTDPFRQTTRLGCEVDGGDPRTMPDLPTPSAVYRVLS